VLVTFIVPLISSLIVPESVAVGCKLSVADNLSVFVGSSESVAVTSIVAVISWLSVAESVAVGCKLNV
jgi:hypothetical protein